ncbi:MAG: PEGA domain-containing protein, partial [Myxococcota bacterium]
GGKRLLGAIGKTQGALAISSNETSADLFLNEEEAGELPMQALGELAPGRYSLRVAKSGYYDWRSDVFVEPGAATPVWVELSEKPPEWYETWWFWTAVGVVAVGAGTFYVVNATSLPDTDLGNVSF